MNAVDMSFGDGRTALMKAASQNQLEIIKLLLDSGANPEVEDAEGLQYTDLLIHDSSLHLCSERECSPRLCMTSEVTTDEISPSRYFCRTDTTSLVSKEDFPELVPTIQKRRCAKCQEPALAFSRILGDRLICMRCKTKLVLSPGVG